jgi:hypothetical protein
MTSFNVTFLKTVLGCDGHVFRTVQRTVNVPNAATVEDAEIAAQADFQRMERVPHWRLHADCCDVSPADRD